MGFSFHFNFGRVLNLCSHAISMFFHLQIYGVFLYTAQKAASGITFYSFCRSFFCNDCVIVLCRSGLALVCFEETDWFEVSGMAEPKPTLFFIGLEAYFTLLMFLLLLSWVFFMSCKGLKESEANPLLYDRVFFGEFIPITSREDVVIDLRRTLVLLERFEKDFLRALKVWFLFRPSILSYDIASYAASSASAICWSSYSAILSFC